MVYKFTLDPLPYAYDALEPYIDEKTMRVHHDGHHQAYTDKLNAAIESYSGLHGITAEDLISDLELIPEAIRSGVRNNGGGYVNHSFFWPLLKKDVPVEGDIKIALNNQFGSFEKFKEDFMKMANGLFGSGWTWLVLKNDALEILNTSNQDSPLSVGKKPILAIDLWEHAYYLKHQNRKAEYIETFFQVINWEQVNDNLTAAKRGGVLL